MIHPRLSVNAICTYPWSFAQDLALWAELGVRHAGLLVSKFGPDPDAQMAQLSAADIRASTLIVESFDLASPESWERTQAAHRNAIQLMARYGGGSIYFTAGKTIGGDRADDLARFAEAVAPTVVHGSTAGVPAAFEPTRRTAASFVNSLREAIVVAELTGLGIVADFGGFWFERDRKELLVRAAPHLALVQLCDVEVGSGDQSVADRRVQVGSGELPLVAMLHEVRDAGYAGLFDLETTPADFSAPVEAAAVRADILAASALLAAASQ